MKTKRRITAASEAELTNAMKVHGLSVWKLAMSLTQSKEESEEIYQETFFRLWSHRKTYQDESHLHNWLLKVAGNLSRSHLRSARHRRTAPLPETIETASPRNDFEEFLESERFHSALSSLNDNERIAMHLLVIEEMTTKEIAHLLGCPHSTIRTRIRRARSTIAALYQEDER